MHLYSEKLEKFKWIENRQYDFIFRQVSNVIGKQKLNWFLCFVKSWSCLSWTVYWIQTTIASCTLLCQRCPGRLHTLHQIFLESSHPCDSRRTDRLAFIHSHLIIQLDTFPSFWKFGEWSSLKTLISTIALIFILWNLKNTLLQNVRLSTGEHPA